MIAPIPVRIPWENYGPSANFFLSGDQDNGQEKDSIPGSSD
jgi:hypothetical protein